TGLFLFIYSKGLIGTLFMITGMLIHSQYLPIAVLLIFYFFSISVLKYAKEGYRRKIEIGMIVLAALFLLNINAMLSVVSGFLDTLPSGQVATSKLHYFDDAREGFRLTSILSIVIYPLLAISLLRLKTKGKNVFLSDTTCDTRLVNSLLLVVM